MSVSNVHYWLLVLSLLLFLLYAFDCVFPLMCNNSVINWSVRGCTFLLRKFVYTLVVKEGVCYYKVILHAVAFGLLVTATFYSTVFAVCRLFSRLTLSSSGTGDTFLDPTLKRNRKDKGRHDFYLNSHSSNTFPSFAKVIIQNSRLLWEFSNTVPFQKWGAGYKFAK